MDAVKHIRKIRLTGSPGSGKTYLGKKLSKQLSISVFEIDKDIYFAVNDMNFTKKRPVKERDAILKKILQKTSWIIEGTYTSPWARSSFAKADIIIFLKVPFHKRLVRLITRRKNRKKESLKEFLKLVHWSINWDKRISRLDKYKHKMKQFPSADAALKWFEVTVKK